MCIQELNSMRRPVTGKFNYTLEETVADEIK